MSQELRADVQLLDLVAKRLLHEFEGDIVFGGNYSMSHSFCRKALNDNILTVYIPHGVMYKHVKSVLRAICDDLTSQGKIDSHLIAGRALAGNAGGMVCKLSGETVLKVVVKVADVNDGKATLYSRGEHIPLFVNERVVSDGIVDLLDNRVDNPYVLYNLYQIMNTGNYDKVGVLKRLTRVPGLDVSENNTSLWDMNTVSGVRYDDWFTADVESIYEGVVLTPPCFSDVRSLVLQVIDEMATRYNSL